MRNEQLAALRVILLLAIGVVLLAGCAQRENKTGTLVGKVTIGPLCSVEPCIVPQQQLNQVYFARRLLVYDEHRTGVMQEIKFGADGIYSAKLAPGKYVIDINKLGMDSSNDVPKEIDVEAGGIVELNVNIDTGIR